MLTIGDPGIYSTYLYMHKRAKENGWQAEMINGVPSFCAVAARLGISLGEKMKKFISSRRHMKWKIHFPTAELVFI